MRRAKKRRTEDITGVNDVDHIEVTDGRLNIETKFASNADTDQSVSA